MIFLELFWAFFKIGAFTFGGGYAMLPLIQAEAEAQGWMTAQELIDFIAVSESTPGPFAVNVSTYVGMETAGILGALCATLGVVSPSFVIILLVAGCFEKWKDSRVVKGCMSGLRPAVAGLIAAAVLSTAQTVFGPGGAAAGTAEPPVLFIVAIFAVMTVLALKKFHPIFIICLSALLGILSGFGAGL